MTSTNEVVVAAAGSGKTRRLVSDALANRDSKVLIITYTRQNLQEIDTRLWEMSGSESHNVTAMSWYEFMLRECVKPYQSYKTDVLTIKSINFLGKRNRFVKKTNFRHYYLDATCNLYRDSVSELACTLDNASGGKVIHRLEQRFDAIFIDELQDLAGYDLDLLSRLLKSKMYILGVVDPRQCVYITNTSSRNSQHRGADIMNWLHSQQAVKLLSISQQTHCYRCNQLICDYSDSLFPEFPQTTSENFETVDDMGVHLVRVEDLDAYRSTYFPQELTWDKNVKRAVNAMNFGEVKGMAFPRVLIHSTKPINAFVETGSAITGITRAKLYVAITRARHSVGIVTESQTTQSKLTYWMPTIIGPYKNRPEQAQVLRN